MVCAVSVPQPLTLATVRRTAYVPGFVYKCLGFCNTDVVLSPKSHNHVFIMPPLTLALSVNSNESARHAPFTLKFASGGADTLKSNSTTSVFPQPPAIGLNTVAVTEVSPGVL